MPGNEFCDVHTNTLRMTFRRISLIFAGLLLTCAGLFLVIKEGFTTQNVLYLLVFGAGLAFFLFEDRFNEWSQMKLQERQHMRYARLERGKIVFPKGYYFRHGYMKGRTELLPDDIEEIRINTHPITAKVNAKELIFLQGLSKEDCEEIAHEHQIPITSPIDNWALICEVFLDVDLDEAAKEHNLSTLVEQGFTKEEVRRIRKKLRWGMELKTYFSMEWIYYGQYDVMEFYPFISEQRYWWAMEIALRGPLPEEVD